MEFKAVSRLQSNHKETVYFLLFSFQEFLVLNWLTLERWKAELTFEPPKELSISPFFYQLNSLKDYFIISFYLAFSVVLI